MSPAKRGNARSAQTQKNHGPVLPVVASKILWLDISSKIRYN